MEEFDRLMSFGWTNFNFELPAGAYILEWLPPADVAFLLYRVTFDAPPDVWEIGFYRPPEAEPLLLSMLSEDKIIHPVDFKRHLFIREGFPLIFYFKHKETVEKRMFLTFYYRRGPLAQVQKAVRKLGEKLRWWAE